MKVDVEVEVDDVVKRREKGGAAAVHPNHNYFFAKGLGGRGFYRKLWGESVCLLRANILLSDVALQKDLGEFASLCRI